MTNTEWAASLGGPIAVLAGGLSFEREVSLASGARVMEALGSVGIDPVLVDVGPDLIDQVETLAPAAILPVLHGATGEDGTVRDVLELLRIPYVGAGPRACQLAFGKPGAKGVFARSGLTVAPGVALPHEAFRDFGADRMLGLIADQLGFPLVVKPASGGSSLGLSVVQEPDQFASAMVRCFSYTDSSRGIALIERFVAGTEVSVAVIEQEGETLALPPVEIVAPDASYDYAARYTPGRSDYFCPARLDDDLLMLLCAQAVTAHTALGLRDLSRIDFIIDADGTPVVLEANVSPGMTETSLFPMAVAAAGRTLGSVLADLIDRAIVRSRG